MGIPRGCLVCIYHYKCCCLFIEDVPTNIFTIRFHVDKLSSAHVYLRLPKVRMYVVFSLPSVILLLYVILYCM